MMILLGIWAILLFGGFLLGRPDPAKTRRMPVWTRVGSSAALAAAGWGWYWQARGSEDATYALLVAAGMTLGLVGDLFMCKVIQAPDRVVAGMGSFGLGHVAYIGALLSRGGRIGALSSGYVWAAWAGVLFAGLIGWYLAVLRGVKPGPLHWAALPYALLLASTAGLAAGLSTAVPSLVPVAVGAGLFLVSDLMLAARIFRRWHPFLVEDAIWLTYGPAQALIVSGAWL